MSLSGLAGTPGSASDCEEVLEARLIVNVPQSILRFGADVKSPAGQSPAGQICERQPINTCERQPLTGVLDHEMLCLRVRRILMFRDPRIRRCRRA